MLGSQKTFRPSEHPKTLAGSVWVLTGTFSVAKEKLKTQIEFHGGTVSGSVSKRTSYLLAGDSAGSKLSKAVDLGINILNESEFRKKIAS